MHLRPSLIKFLFFQKSALCLPSTLLPKGKTTTPTIPILWKSCKFNVWCKLEFCIILNLFFKSPAFSLVVHVRQNLSNFTQNNLHSIFKERPLHVLVLKSGMRYKLILKFYSKTGGGGGGGKGGLQQQDEKAIALKWFKMVTQRLLYWKLSILTTVHK